MYEWNDNLSAYVDKTFKYESLSEKHDLDLTLCSLVYTKMKNLKHFKIYDENHQVISGPERYKRTRKASLLHNMLYKFTLEKCEKIFFADPYLRRFFLEYSKAFEDRWVSNPVIGNNKEVYRAAIEMVLQKFNITAA